MFKRTILTVIATLILWASVPAGPPAAHAAAVSNGTALLDWESFEITIGSGMRLTWTGRGEYVSAYAEDDGMVDGPWSSYDDDYTSAWSWGAINETASVTYAEGSAWTTDYEVGASAWAEADGSQNTFAYADADADRFVYFDISGSGYVTVKVGYAIDVSTSTDYVGENAYLYATAYLGLWSSGGDWIFDEDYMEYDVYDGASDMLAKSGTLTTMLWFNDGDSGEIFAYAFSEAVVTSNPIPEPSTMLPSAPGSWPHRS